MKSDRNDDWNGLDLIREVRITMIELGLVLRGRRSNEGSLDVRLTRETKMETEKKKMPDFG